ncbi:MAG: glycoside hydrolase family 31 protein [Ruminococcaceae bacterium]|nr:glycoside hydrolase family 31 protein [Oscillospiraceae bacterium]
MQTLKFTHIAPGVLRLRLSETHGTTLAERYSILTIPAELSDSGITVDGNSVILPNGRKIAFSFVEGFSDEYNSLRDSLAEEFSDKYTDFQAIIGTPEDAEKPSPIPAEQLPPESCGAIKFTIDDNELFYGAGEGANDRIELRGRAYQNWARYQYNEIPIPMVVSSENWGVFLNARARTFFDIAGREDNTLLCLFEDDEIDLFIFTGENYVEILKHYHMLTGQPMLLPKYAYGLTYIAPIFSDQMEVLADIERFRREHIPLDHVSLEPGWMKEFYDYSLRPDWNIERFHICSWHMNAPKPHEKIFPQVLKRFGCKLSLWRCLRYDYTAEAERVIAGGSVEEYGEPWYDHLKRFVNAGIDGFKLDPADMLCCFDGMDRPRLFNGLTSMQMHNYNQILCTKQVFDGFTQQTGKRSMHHYSGGYSGIQRWSASTTGDNGGELGAMIWLETLALSGHMNTTIDMNLHHKESIHFGMFVPWAHLNAWSGVEQPWYAGDEMHQIFVEYARLRYRIIPYIYSAAIEGHEESVPMIRPMPIAFPNDKASIRLERQYMLGDYILLSSYADKVHLPEGKWIDAWTGKEYYGPCDLDPYTPPKNRGGGLFIKGGAIIPGWRDRDFIKQYDDSKITLDIYPYGDSEYILREDDGESLDYLTKTSCHTKITVHETTEKVTIRIGERVGDYEGKPESRTWLVLVHPSDIDNDQLLDVKCESASDKVIFTISDNKCGVFDCDASDVIKR